MPPAPPSTLTQQLQHEPPGLEVEILPGEKLAVLLKQYSPNKVRFSWKGQHYWAFKASFEQHVTPETEQERE